MIFMTPNESPLREVNHCHGKGRGHPCDTGAVQSSIGVKDPVSVPDVDGNTVVFHTGKPVTLPVTHIKNPQGTPHFGARFGQDIEPHGRYVSMQGPGFYSISNSTESHVTFKSPLVLSSDGGYGPDGWKARLSKAFGGKKGIHLSRAIVKAGFDGIVTVGTFRGEPDIGEIVDLTSLR